MSNSLDPDQARRFSDGPDLGPNCFAKVYQQTTLADKELKGLYILKKKYV